MCFMDVEVTVVGTAIINKNIIEFSYHDRHRVAEPHVLGMVDSE